MKVLDHRFFRHFSPQHAKRLARAAQRVTFPARAIIFEEGDPSDSVHLALGAITKRSDDESTRRSCDTISHQLRRMSSLVEDVLQYARGNSTLDRRRVPLRNLFKHLLYLNAETLRHAGITARVRAAGGLVAAIDHDRMIRVLQNLLSNAIEALGTDRKGLIVLAARRLRGVCELTVRDNGPGIPKVIWSTLFQPFTSHGKPGGTGLGLAIAKSIVEAHGGEITFESKKGAGTTFRIRLPLPA